MINMVTYLICFVGLPRTLDQNASHNLSHLDCHSGVVHTCLHTTFGTATETPKWNGKTSFSNKTGLHFDFLHDKILSAGKELWGTHLFSKRIKDVLQTHPNYNFYIFIRTDVRLEGYVDVPKYLKTAKGKLVLINSARRGGGGACHDRDWDYCWIGSKKSVLDFVDKWFYGPWPRPPITTYADISSERAALFTRLIRVSAVTKTSGPEDTNNKIQDITVCGAGNSGVNGVYLTCGIGNWSMHDFILRYNIRTREWLIIHRDEPSARYAVKSEDMWPPKSGWHVCKRGMAPAPHVSIHCLDNTADPSETPPEQRVFLIANNPRLSKNRADELNARFRPGVHDMIVRMNHCEHSDKLFAGQAFTHVTRPDRGWFHGMEVETESERKKRSHRMFYGSQSVRPNTKDIVFINCESEPNASLASQLAGDVPYIVIPIVLKSRNKSGSTGFCVLDYMLQNMPEKEIYLLGWTFRSEIAGCHDWDSEKRIISEWLQDNRRLHLIDFD